MLAEDAVVPRPALAHEAVDVVVAAGSVLAGLAGALVHLRRAALSHEARAARAGEIRHAVVAGTAVLTRVLGGGWGRGGHVRTEDMNG